MKRLIFIFILAAFIFYLGRPFPPSNSLSYGLTFSKIFAERMGLDWRKTFLALLDDLRVRKFRLIAYWPELEFQKGIFNFSDLEWQIKEASRRNSEIILALGQKLPRWPECHIPSWAVSLPETERQEALLNYIKVSVERFKNEKAIKIWQVENEPFLEFGDCPKLDVKFLDKEISLVRLLDPSRKILITDSGEISDWVRAAKKSDIFGTTMYFQVYNRILGQIRYPLWPGFFRLKQRYTDFFVGPKPKVVIEFQLEPWGKIQLYDLPLKEQFKFFPLNQFDRRIEFLKNTGFGEAYLWGGEWWYWLKEKKGIPDYWDKATPLF